jgi:hypothetical protein
MPVARDEITNIFLPHSTHKLKQLKSTVNQINYLNDKMAKTLITQSKEDWIVDDIHYRKLVMYRLAHKSHQ